mgnify:CR=1 FL=1
MSNFSSRRAEGWRSPLAMLMIMAVAMGVAFSIWRGLLNNFAVEAADFTGAEMGALQSIREIPGFLAFTAVFFLFLFREQTFALLALAILGIGTALTGYFPTFWGLAITTTVMSVGFHYYETMNQSLSLQLLDKDRAASNLGKIMAAGSFASIVAMGVIYILWQWAGLSYQIIYAVGGGLALLATIYVWAVFPKFDGEVEQHRKIILRQKYWLYYALTFMGGARRQIFIVFASFLMVEKFGLSVPAMSLLYLVNMTLNMLMAPYIGRLIDRWGERRALTFEYIGLIVVFVLYGVVDNAWFAMALYIIDHFLVAVAIAMRTYFQKIADPADIAPTAGVAFSINHIAAVVIPVVFGLIWLTSPSAVFWIGAAMAGISLGLSRFVPYHPAPGHETTLKPRNAPAIAE